MESTGVDYRRLLIYHWTSAEHKPILPNMTAFTRPRRPILFSTRRALAVMLFLGVGAAGAQLVPYGTPTPTPQPRGFFLFRLPQKPVVQAIPAQEGPRVSQSLLALSGPQSDVHVTVSLSRQRVYLLYGDSVVIDAPVSSGKLGHETPTGRFPILVKEPAHFSNIYGNFVDKTGRVVRGGVSEKIDTAPSGTHFEGAPMRWFMRLTNTGVGMHIGILPGYAASHGCVRLPSEIAPLIYERVKVGTVVTVQE